MIVNIKDITSALSKISALTVGDKTIPGVLLDIHDDSVSICYSDGRKSVIEKINAMVEETDRRGQIVVNYQRLSDIISSCQPSGKIVTNDIEIKFMEDSTLKIRAEKKIAHNVDEEEEQTYKVCSVFEQSIGWVEAGSSLKVAILSRMNYDSIFNADVVDTWDISRFRSALDKTSTEKSRIVYVSPKNKCAFVSNMAYLSEVPVEDASNYAIIITTAMAKAISDILGKTNAKEVSIHVTDRKYLSVFTDDNAVGIWVEMSNASDVHLTTLNRYQSKGYRGYQLTFIRDILKNVVDAAIASDKSEKTTLQFGDSKIEASAKELRITSTNTNASISNSYEVVCTDCIGELDDIDNLELPISLKVLSDMLNKCSTDYVGIDIDDDGTEQKCLRVSEINLEELSNVYNRERDILQLSIEEPIPKEVKLRCRLETLGIKNYTVSSK